MALVRVIVPPQAEVFFGDVPTQSRGMNRWYHSPALEMGKDYTYTITAVWNEGGREMAATKEIDVEAGQESVANFMDRNLWRDARSTPNGHRNGDLRAPDSRYIPPSDRIERERVPNLERDREIDRINETNREELNRNRDRNRDADKPDSTTPKPGDLNRNRSNKTPDPINPKPTDPNRGNDPPKP
jgi:uncharacterized protein (TIGR03000 family)